MHPGTLCPALQVSKFFLHIIAFRFEFKFVMKAVEKLKLENPLYMVVNYDILIRLVSFCSGMERACVSVLLTARLARGQVLAPVPTATAVLPVAK